MNERKRYVFLFFFSLFCLTNCGVDMSEGRGHYGLALHILETGELGYAEAEIWNLTVAPNGRTYGSHEFGNTLMLLPLAAAERGVESRLSAMGKPPELIRRVREFGPPFQSSLYSALTATALYAILRRHFGRSRRWAFLGALAMATTTFCWTYSRMLFDNVLCGTLLTGSFLGLLDYRRDGRLRHVAAAFALLGLGVATRVSMVLPVAASAVYVLAAEGWSIARSWRAAAVAALALAPFLAWQLWYNHLRTGNPLVSPVQTAQYAANNGLDGPLLTGVMGLLFSPGKSVFVYAPLLVLSVARFPRFARSHRPEALYLAILAGAWLLLHAKLRSWWGAWGWGPRHFVTVVPLLLLPALADLPAIARSRGRGPPPSSWPGRGSCWPSPR